jgi:serine protease
MRRVLIRAGIVAATLFAPLALHVPLAQVPAASASALPARVIVKFRADSQLLRKQALANATPQAAQAQALGQRIGIALTAGRALSDRSHVVFASGVTSQQLAARIAAESDIEYAVADERKHIVSAPNDSFYASGPAVGPTSGGPAVGQWYLKPPGPAGTGLVAGTAPAAINAEQAWDISTGSASIVVADLDTGIRFDHPDLQGNVIPGYDMVSPDDGASGTNFSSAGDNSGRDADASDPGDGLTASDVANNPIFKNCTAGPSSWHGTQTAGLIAATTDNSVGIAGVGRTVHLMPVRVLGKCGGFDSDIQAGMLWAAGIDVPGVPHNTTPARVLNMSLGGAQDCSPQNGAGYIDAINQVNAAGAVVVVAAGNGDSTGLGVAVGSPANCPGALAVTALRHVGDKVGFSNLGPEVAIGAPGGNCPNGGPCLYPIMTTSNSGTIAPVAGVTGASYTDSFNASIGTSFSAPLVSGTVALMLSVEPSLTPAQVKAKLQSSARPFPTSGGSTGTVACTSSSTSQGECYCTTSTCGAGMLDAHAAVASVAGVQAAIALTTTTPTAGQDVALNSSSVESAGHTIASYAWAILNAGSSGATITSATNTASVTVRPTAAGTFLIQLATTDNLGFVSTTTLSVVVVAPVVVTPPASVPPTTSSGGGGGGGGALGVVWLLLLVTAVLALALTPRRERARQVRVSVADRSSRTG